MSKGAKSIAFKVPASRLAQPADAWVAKREAEPGSDRELGRVTPLKAGEGAPVVEKEPMVRFTLDVPQSLHRRVKMQCAGQGKKIADVMREILEREFPAS